MKAKKKNTNNYRVTIGYRAVISVDVTASSEEEAKALAMQDFEKNKERWFKKNIVLEDDNFGPYGVCNTDKTWSTL